MSLARKTLLSLCTSALFQLLSSEAHAGTLQVTAVNPPPNTAASTTTTVSITFDRPLLTSSITPASFRVFARGTGAAPGAFSFLNGNRTVRFTRTRPFSAGEVVFVNLANTIQAGDLSPFRAEGFAYSFGIAAGPSDLDFEEIAVMSNRINNQQTRIYGASTSDLNEDGYLDLTTVNEVSADVRVFLNLSDGTGLYDDFLAPQGIGVEASPNEPADFNNDGHSDLCVAAVLSHSIWVLLGAGDGTFGTITEIPVGDFPHGVAVLDADGDGDPDIVNSNLGDSNLSYLENDGSGSFAPPVYFATAVNGEYGLISGDMDGDGVADVVVGGRDGAQILTMLGNGDGTFTPAGVPQASGGITWVVALGDVNGDEVLDATTANSVSNNGALLLGVGNGRFGSPEIIEMNAHTVSTDLGDLDGDGDLDWILSSFGGGYWRVFTNDGAGNFTFDQQIQAPSNPSCAIILDFDNDLDLDLALTDEIADVVVLMENLGLPTSEVPEGSLARAVTLLPNSPNPFRDDTLIRFGLQKAGDVRVEIYDHGGRRVVSSQLRGLPAGMHSYRFTGQSPDGRALANGIYQYKVMSDGSTSSDRMILIR